MITSMREHRGHLYLGGILNNRIGLLQVARRRHELRGSTKSAGGVPPDAGGAALMEDQMLGRGDASITVPVFDGALKSNNILEEAATFAVLEAPEDLATDGRSLFVADGGTVLRYEPRGRTLDRPGWRERCRRRRPQRPPGRHRPRLPARRRPRRRPRRARAAHRRRPARRPPLGRRRRLEDERRQCDRRRAPTGGCWSPTARSSTRSRTGATT